MHRRTIFALIAGAAVLLPFSPGAFAETPPPAVMQKVHAAQQQVSTIGMEDYRKVVDSPGEAIIIDVREPHEYAEFNIGAINIPLTSLPMKMYDFDDDKDREIIVHCRSGMRSASAKALMVQSGFTNVRNLLGGMLEWQATVGK